MFHFKITVIQALKELRIIDSKRQKLLRSNFQRYSHALEESLSKNKLFVSIACRGLARGSAQTFLLCTTQPKRRLFTLVKDYVILGAFSH